MKNQTRKAKVDWIGTFLSNVGRYFKKEEIGRPGGKLREAVTEEYVRHDLW